MEFLIIYFSGTGNTELLAKEIAKRLLNEGHTVEKISIENISDITQLDLTNKIIGFGFPVYKLSYPEIFNTVISYINNKTINNNFFVFSTYARFTAKSSNEFISKLNRDKFSLIAECSFKSPSCGISARKDVNHFDYKSVMFFEDDINLKIDSFVREILNLNVSNCIKISKIKFLNKLKNRFIEDIEKTKYPLLKVIDSKCETCGICVKYCPEQNIEIYDKKLKIKDNMNCLHCLRCMNHCPSNALYFGKLTKGTNRYTYKIRDELFNKAINGQKEEMWNDFPKIIKDWRKNTIKYWLTHWYRSEI